MQALGGTVLRIAFDVSETFPFGDGCSDRSRRYGWFECRCKVPHVRTMAKGHHGFASDLATEGDCPVGGCENGILRLSL